MADIYGVMAEFEEADQLLEAGQKAYAEGYREMDAYSPFHIEGLADAVGFHRSRVSLVFLVAGIIGGVGAFFMQWAIAKLDYPINVGGRPLNSWPAWIPITFELTVLFSGVIGFIGLLIMNNLPMPYHPVFNVPSFSASASRDRFFLCIEARDPKFDLEQTRAFLSGLNPLEVSEVEK